MAELPRRISAKWAHADVSVAPRYKGNCCQVCRVNLLPGEAYAGRYLEEDWKTGRWMEGTFCFHFSCYIKYRKELEATQNQKYFQALESQYKELLAEYKKVPYAD